MYYALICTLTYFHLCNFSVQYILQFLTLWIYIYKWKRPKNVFNNHLLEPVCAYDIFRINNPHLTKIHLDEKNPNKPARLDFILISEKLQVMFPSIQYENSYKLNHSLVILQC